MYETNNALSAKEASEVKLSLTTLKYQHPDLIETSGVYMRKASKFLSDTEAKINYIALRKRSLFQILPQISNDIQGIILEYAIDPEKDHRSKTKTLTFG